LLFWHFVAGQRVLLWCRLAFTSMLVAIYLLKAAESHTDMKFFVQFNFQVVNINSAFWQFRWMPCPYRNNSIPAVKWYGKIPSLCAHHHHRHVRSDSMSRTTSKQCRSLGNLYFIPINPANSELDHPIMYISNIVSWWKHCPLFPCTGRLIGIHANLESLLKWEHDVQCSTNNNRPLKQCSMIVDYRNRKLTQASSNRSKRSGTVSSSFIYIFSLPLYTYTRITYFIQLYIDIQYISHINWITTRLSGLCQKMRTKPGSKHGEAKRTSPCVSATGNLVNNADDSYGRWNDVLSMFLKTPQTTKQRQKTRTTIWQISSEG